MVQRLNQPRGPMEQDYFGKLLNPDLLNTSVRHFSYLKAV